MQDFCKYLYQNVQKLEAIGENESWKRKKDKSVTSAVIKSILFHE